MTIRQDVARMFSARLVGAALHYKFKPNPDLQAFVDKQTLPSRGPNTTVKQHQHYHKVAWTAFWIAFARAYPDEQAEHDQTNEQHRY